MGPAREAMVSYTKHIVLQKKNESRVIYPCFLLPILAGGDSPLLGPLTDAD